jgi:KaiC/GvpD/RAD55 family RecA-like ATPase
MTDSITLSPQAGLLGLVMQIGTDFSRDPEAMETVGGILNSLTPDMFAEAEQPVFSLMADLLASGRPAGLANVQYGLPSYPAARLRRMLVEGKKFPDIQTASEALRHQYDKSVVTEWAELAYKAAQEGSLDAARGFMESGASSTPLRALQEIPGFSAYTFDPEADIRVSTGFKRLDSLTGGGLGIGGRNAMSLLVASTNVGKSTYAQIIALNLKAQGHHVLYFSGEASRQDINTELVRLHLEMNFEQIIGMRNFKTGVMLERFQAGIDRINSMRGEIQIWDEDFDGALVRSVAGQKARDLAILHKDEDPTTRPRLVVIVDNIDHAIEFDASSRLREDQVYDREARAFLRAAQSGGYHTMLLSQANADGDKRDGAPLKGDVAAAKKLVAHVGIMISLYRPTTDVDAQSDGRRSKHWVAVRKQRGGRVGELEFTSNPSTGVWIDPEEPRF